MTDNIDTLISQLTLEEKITLLAGADTWRTHAIERLGIPALKVSDGPNGVRGEQKDTKSQSSASFPVGTAMGATWNPELVQAVGAALGQETKAKGAHILLGPTVNTHRHPLAGRNFECFSEDPYLSAQMATAYINGLQSESVGACVKHFACNDQEFERFTISTEVDERTLREIYLPPFKAAVQDAGTWSIMSAYNQINGISASEHKHLLLDILKGEWGFDGLVISDWYGTYSENVPGGGLDLEMPGPARWMGENALAKVRSGDLDEAVIDDKVRRLLKTLEKAGLFRASAHVEEKSIDRPEHRALIRKAGSEAIVLLKNEADLLPLDPRNIRSIAVIGQRAVKVTFQGGGSSEVNPHYVINPLDAIRDRYGQTLEVLYAPGPSVHRQFPLLEKDHLRAEDGAPEKLTVRQYDNPSLDGAPFKTFQAGGSELSWFGESAPDFDPSAFSLRMSGGWVVPRSGNYTLSLTAVGRARCWLEGEKLFDWWDTADGKWTNQTKEINLEGGRAYDLRVEFASMPGERWRTIRVGCLPPQPEDPIGDAVAIARSADVAVVFVGLTPEWEGEGFDRINMDLPGQQDELITQVAKANQNTIVVLNSGSPLHMPWIDEVHSVLQMWYLGQESGNAITDVLFGETAPGGRLPTTFPKRIEDSPAYDNFPGENGKVFYREGLYVGYRHYDRHDISPLFPFGHGLTYTEFEYANFRVEASGEGIRAQVDVKNLGNRTAQEVVQLYVGAVNPPVERPPKELKAFSKVALAPGESSTVKFSLSRDALAYFDAARGKWTVEPGEFEISAGRSAGDIRCSEILSWETR